MRRWFYCLLTVIIAFILTSCATIPQDEVVRVDRSPIISKSIEETAPLKPSGLKRKVAIARFTNETKYGQSFFIDKDSDRIGKQAVDILSAKLIATDKFIILERADLSHIQRELNIGDAAPLKNMADYLIVGSITAFGRREQSKVGIFTRVKKQIAYAKVYIRLVDVYTGEVLYSEEAEGEAYSEAGTVMGLGGNAGYDSVINDKALDAAITNLASNILENLQDKPWRAYILGFEDDRFIISGGKSQNIKPKMIFDIILEGKKIKNRQTNMTTTLPGKKIGKLQVEQVVGDSVRNEVSICKLVSGNLRSYQKKNDFSELYVQEEKGK